MPGLKVQEIAKEQNLNMSQLQLKVGVAMGTIRRYWYGTKDGKETGPSLTEVDLSILQRLAKALGVRVADLIAEDDRLTLRLALA